MAVMGQRIFLLHCLHVTTLCRRQENVFIQLQPIICWLAQTKKKKIKMVSSTFNLLLKLDLYHVRKETRPRRKQL